MWASLIAPLIIAASGREPRVPHALARGGSDPEPANLRAVAAEVIEPRTSLDVIGLDADDRKEIADCPDEERLACWVLVVRGADEDGQEDEADGAPRFLLVLTIAAGAG